MRVFGTTAPRISTPPESQLGATTLTAGRAEDVARQLLQDQSDAERHQQGVQRAVVHPLIQRPLRAATPISAADDEADEQRDDQRCPLHSR